MTARENIADTVAARAMTCIHGNAGFGKTLAVNTCLRELEDIQGEGVCRVTLRARPIARAPRCELFETLRERATQIAIVFVGGADAPTVLRREPMRSSRIFIRQQFTRLSPEEVLDVVPLFHPLPGRR
ncbi:hypothetical protein [Streptomyces sp. 2132.2]|uniref:hypothetical protein n=1 Tax=Streptomyces sp. 2132.2 TaxID=2485161 RepID=UPI0021A2FFFD|nr:hypothetical protein [Streptomyces sp. 2132.2]